MFKFSIFPKLNSWVIRQQFDVNLPMEDTAKMVFDSISKIFPNARLISNKTGFMIDTPDCFATFIKP